MAVCDNCGNDYDKAVQVMTGGDTDTFDSVDGAIHKLAPRCSHGEPPIVGHGAESDGAFFCCAHGAKHTGETELQDRA